MQVSSSLQHCLSACSKLNESITCLQRCPTAEGKNELLEPFQALADGYCLSKQKGAPTSSSKYRSGRFEFNLHTIP